LIKIFESAADESSADPHALSGRKYPDGAQYLDIDESERSVEKVTGEQDMADNRGVIIDSDK
jgi:hypothetical protein